MDDKDEALLAGRRQHDGCPLLVLGTYDCSNMHRNGYRANANVGRHITGVVVADSADREVIRLVD